MSENIFESKNIKRETMNMNVNGKAQCSSINVLQAKKLNKPSFKGNSPKDSFSLKSNLYDSKFASINRQIEQIKQNGNQFKSLPDSALANPKTNPMTQDHLKSLFRETLELDKIGIYQGDIDPSNLLLSKDGKVNITFFNHAKAFTPFNFVENSSAHQFPTFMAPSNANMFERATLFQYLDKLVSDKPSEQSRDKASSLFNNYVSESADYHMQRAEFLRHELLQSNVKDLQASIKKSFLQNYSKTEQEHQSYLKEFYEKLEIKPKQFKNGNALYSIDELCSPANIRNNIKKTIRYEELQSRLYRKPSKEVLTFLKGKIQAEYNFREAFTHFDENRRLTSLPALLDTILLTKKYTNDAASLKTKASSKNMKELFEYEEKFGKHWTQNYKKWVPDMADWAFKTNYWSGEKKDYTNSFAKETTGKIQDSINDLKSTLSDFLKEDNLSKAIELRNKFVKKLNPIASDIIKEEISAGTIKYNREITQTVTNIAKLLR